MAPFLVLARPIADHVGMEPEDDLSEARAWGRALAKLRTDRGLTQPQAAEAIDWTEQNWRAYEGGRRLGILKRAVRSKLAVALDATLGDLDLAYAQTSSAPSATRELTGLREREAPTFPPPASPWVSNMVERLARLRQHQLTDDTLAPWASSGILVLFDPKRWPRAGQGCVLELSDGRRLVKIFVRADDEAIVVRQLQPAKELSFPQGEVKALAAVTDRVDA